MTGAAIEDAARAYAGRDYPEAERICRAMLAAAPDDFDALHLLGVLCVNSGRAAEAADHLAAARKLRPADPQLLLNLGNALQALQDDERAAAVYRQALALTPHHAGLLNNFGASLRRLGRQAEAIACYRTLVASYPDHAPGLNNLAGLLRDDGQLEEAATLYRKALDVAPPDTPPERLAEVVSGLGQALLGLRRYGEALAACRELAVRHPGLNSVTWNESLLLLLFGAYRDGWRKYEARWTVPAHDRPHPDARVLALDAVAGRRVLITGEQGRGDIIQFVRYLPLLADRGARVTLQVYDDLRELLATLHGIDAVIGEAAPEPQYDLRSSLLSLPLAFDTQVATIPAQLPYLRVPPERAAQWRDRLGPRRLPRIGLVWSGSQHIPNRSMSAAMLAPIFACTGVEFHVLQKTISEADAPVLPNGVRSHTGAIRDFADTAALIDAMDLVISIDTAVAHLAGALGRPVWIMLPFNADWRWFLDRDDSPWYPTARLFRQLTRGVWPDVVARIASALAGRIATGFTAG